MEFKQRVWEWGGPRREFGSSSLPSFPPNKLFALTVGEGEERRLLLEKYLQLVSQEIIQLGIGHFLQIYCNVNAVPVRVNIFPNFFHDPFLNTESTVLPRYDNTVPNSGFCEKQYRYFFQSFETWLTAILIRIHQLSTIRIQAKNWTFGWQFRSQTFQNQS
jgi:hypothetical protein